LHRAVELVVCSFGIGGAEVGYDFGEEQVSEGFTGSGCEERKEGIQEAFSVS
jgi:hypothetical protein